MVVRLLLVAAALTPAATGLAAAAPCTASAATEMNPLDASEEDQSVYLEKIFHRCGGNRSKMARELGIPRTTLLYKLKKVGLMD